MTLARKSRKQFHGIVFPTGETAPPPSPTEIVFSRRISTPFDPPPFAGRWSRQALPYAGLQPNLIVRRFVRDRSLPWPGHVGRSQLPNTGEDPPAPTPVDSLRPRTFVRDRVIPLPGRSRFSRLFHTGIEANTGSLIDQRRRQTTPAPPVELLTGRIFRSRSLSSGPSQPKWLGNRIVRPQFVPPALPAAGIFRQTSPQLFANLQPHIVARRFVRAVLDPFPFFVPSNVRRAYRQRLPGTGETAATFTTIAAGAPFAGGHRIIGVEWIGQRAIRARFATTYGSTYHYQLYAGRTLIGTTETKTARQIVGQLVPSDSPQPLQLLAVTTAQRLTDFGSLLPLRAYNRVKITYTLAGVPADFDVVEITAGTAPAGAVDTDNVLIRQRYDEARVYTFITDPFSASGVWNFEIAGRDTRPSGGNRGTADTLSATLIVHPPDVTLDANEKRFNLSIASQQATVTYTLPS